MITRIEMKGAYFVKSKYYRGRWCGYFYGTDGKVIRDWVLNTFDDDQHWTSEEEHRGEIEGLYTDEQINFIKLRWG